MHDVNLLPNINRVWTTILIECLKNHQIKTFFTSPGLRNAPILSAISALETAKVHSGIDERSMAFRALGYSKFTGSPGVLVCTSGTAMANYLPAVIEAYQTNIPLIIISADRPKELVELGDNQSIIQNNIFGDYLRGQLLLDTPNIKIEPQEFYDKLSRFLNGDKPAGPLHINFPFSEPLDLTTDTTPSEYKNKLNYLKDKRTYDKTKIEFELPKIDKSKKTLLVVGAVPEYEDKSQIKSFINESGLPCFLDIGSGLKFSDIDSNKILPSFEHPEIRTLLEQNKPEVIIHLGGRLVSKHYYSFLKKTPELEVLLVGNEGQYTHPAQNPTWKINAPISNFCKKAIETSYIQNRTPYTFDCKHVVGQKEDIIDNSPFSFPSISKRIVELLPEGSNLYLGNSTSIRSFDAFASTKTHAKNIKVFSHRGASGIEGFNASALGLAEVSDGPTVLVHGDIGFLHDMGSLLMYKNLKLPLINIIVNNKGGGIFRHLPIANDSVTLPLITTEHDMEFEKLFDWLGLDYTLVDNISRLESAFGNALKKQSICFIEATINQDENMAVYERLKTLKL
ncbi:MAG: 2-succinyl-5-enolpyruvyl-6-hydroxy-3-cyclohexene-1-carboxylic-acid synthase [Halobacteriovorax sp.]|nr:2-succinyl-5-enolpyruvyl-6-hydroxy-3-cyclohexene-1-carboxylic-acid synthase [Halobacteriovorax sp.]|tara:strand:- start:239032 stop:240729 length:1698 start_codon:yes stop_codon:yes gene_type:complete